MEQNQNYKGCLMIDINIPDWNKYITNFVKKEHIYEDEGFEENPHVTVLYGFNNETNIEEIKKTLIPNYKIKIQFKNISLFENDEYDVLKFDVDSLELKLMNEILKNRFDYQNDYNEYWPHVTIGYLKSGSGSQYIKTIKEFELRADKYRYSTKDRNDEKQETIFEIYK